MRPERLISVRRFRMRTRRFHVVSTVLAVVAGLTVAAASAAAASGAPPAQKSGPHALLEATGNPASPGGLALNSPAAPPQQLAQNTTVTLPTGDQVRLSSAGDSQQVTPIPAGSGHGRPPAAETFVRFSWAGDEYVVPDPAVPYLGSTLDPRLFDVSYLARAHLGTTGSAGIPVDITYTSASAAASVAGLRLTRRSGDTASGTITTAQASQLGSLLAAQWHAALRHHPEGPPGRLPGVKSIRLAPPAGAPPLPPAPGRMPAPANAGVGPRYYTLTLNFTDQNGKSGIFSGFVQNVDNAALGTSFTASATTGNVGSESLSVPKGNYSLEFSVITPNSSGTAFDTALVVKPQVTVKSNTTVDLDARTAVPYQATSPGVSTPARTDILSFWRWSQTGGNCGGNVQEQCTEPYESPIYGMYLYSVSPNPPSSPFPDKLSATPTAPVSEGSFFFDATTQLYSGETGPAASQYVFDFPHPGAIPSSLTYAVPAASLTTVHTDFYTPATTSGSWSGYAVTEVYFPVGDGEWSFQGLEANAAAGKRIDYWYSSDPDLDLWQYWMGNDASNYGLTGALLSIHPGQQITANLDRAPLVPSSLAPPFWRAAGLFSAAGELQFLLSESYADPRRHLVCTACRQGNTGTLDVMSYGDSDPVQYEDSPYYTTTSSVLRFYRNGILAIENPTGQNPWLPLGMELPLLPQPSTYQLDWTLSPAPGAAPAAASIETDWTFRSGPADPAASLPASETCAPDATRPCAFLPLLFPSYDLPLDDNNQATAGTPEQIDFAVTGQQNSPAPSGLSAAVSASFDGGQTWTALQSATSLGNGRFTATISQPALSATNGFVSLRVMARDSSGDSVTQTIPDAYGLTS
jgi:hypothetical protein